MSAEDCKLGCYQELLVTVVGEAGGQWSEGESNMRIILLHAYFVSLTTMIFSLFLNIHILKKNEMNALILEEFD